MRPLLPQRLVRADQPLSRYSRLEGWWVSRNTCGGRITPCKWSIGLTLLAVSNPWPFLSTGRGHRYGPRRKCFSHENLGSKEVV